MGGIPHFILNIVPTEDGQGILWVGIIVQTVSISTLTLKQVFGSSSCDLILLRKISLKRMFIQMTIVKAD